jgi:hypothetical protein
MLIFTLISEENEGHLTTVARDETAIEHCQYWWLLGYGTA